VVGAGGGAMGAFCTRGSREPALVWLGSWSMEVSRPNEYYPVKSIPFVGVRATQLAAGQKNLIRAKFS
jgi:hypothetical protein